MKITPADSRKSEQSRVRKKESSTSPGGKSEFARELQQHIVPRTDTDLEEMLEELGEREARFLDHQTLYEMNRYRETVQTLLKYILDNGLTATELKQSRFKKNQAPQRIIEMIDERLVAISRAITTHNRAFNLMKTMEEIRGLILDLKY